MALDKELDNIKKHISLKNETYSGDIVIVGTPSGIYYATVRDIKPDIKKNWYIIRFTMLVLPPVEISWKLRQPQMCGEIFTINGEEHFMAALSLESEPVSETIENHECSTNAEQSGKVLQLVQKKRDS